MSCASCRVPNRKSSGRTVSGQGRSSASRQQGSTSRRLDPDRLAVLGTASHHLPNTTRDLGTRESANRARPLPISLATRDPKRVFQGRSFPQGSSVSAEADTTVPRRPRSAEGSSCSVVNERWRLAIGRIATGAASQRLREPSSGRILGPAGIFQLIGSFSVRHRLPRGFRLPHPTRRALGGHRARGPLRGLVELALRLPSCGRRA